MVKIGGKNVYEINYTPLKGGKDYYTESELFKIQRRDARRLDFEKKFRENRISKNAETAMNQSKKYKKKRLNNNFSKAEMRDLIQNKCNNFNDLFKNLSIFSLTIKDIPKENISENIFLTYYICLFSYVLPNLYFNFKNINKVEKTEIDFKSLIKSKDVLIESLKTIFFINKDVKMYNDIIQPNKIVEDLPYELGSLDILFSDKALTYKSKEDEEEGTKILDGLF